MASDYNKIKQENIREYGEGTRHLAFLGNLYTDRTHFIFELLQNAEDAGATKVLFQLSRLHLKVLHNGRPFNEKDVRGICGVGEGTKAKDLTQIGKFGIGFKSVYSYTSSPEIHSGDEHFTIESYVRPKAITPREIGDYWTTLFIFDFNNEKVEPKNAFNEISARLSNLNPRTLLFLRKIEEIEFKLPERNGIYLRDEVKRDKAREVTVIGQNNGKDENETWLLFERVIKVPDSEEDSTKKVLIEIAFHLVKKNNSEEVMRIKESPLFVFFPTEKETKLGFLLQGPFRTTPARDNIPIDDSWNKNLIEEMTYLLAEVLPIIKDMGLLTVSFLEALPIRRDDFQQGSMFYKIFIAVREELKYKELLPADEKDSFVLAQNSKLASVEWLRKLLKEDQLKKLLKTQTKLKWISGEITEAKNELWKYFRDEIKVNLINPDFFANNINHHFLENQTDLWFIDFYRFLKNQKALWKKSDSDRQDNAGPLRSKPFIRLNDGRHVKPFNDGNSPNVYLYSGLSNDISLPIVKVEIVKEKEIQEFFKELGIPEYDVVEEVLKYILPKYSSDLSKNLSLDEHKRDIEKIRIAYKTDSQDKKKRLRDALLETEFILSENPFLNKNSYRKPYEVYFKNETLKIYFHENSEVGFVSSEYDPNIYGIFKELNVSENIRIEKRKCNDEGHIIIKEEHGKNARGFNGFDPYIKVDGLKQALKSPTIERSVIIWNRIAMKYSACIRGTIQKSTTKTFTNIAKEEFFVSKFGRLLIESAWLPGRNSIFHRPSELSLDDLPEQFERSEELAISLGMIENNLIKLAEETGIKLENINFYKKLDQHPELLEKFKQELDDEIMISEFSSITVEDTEHKRRIEAFTSLSDEQQEMVHLMTFPPETPPESIPNFKDGLKEFGRSQRGRIVSPEISNSPVTNIERYQEKLDEEVMKGIEDHNSNPREITFSWVKNSPSNAEARRFLYQQYQGSCQITKTTFSKASRNSDGVAENYFEACSFLSYQNANYLNDEGNMLCVSADTMAKLKFASFEFLESIEDVIATFKNDGERAEYVSIKIQLAGEECTITWNQRHFMRLVALWENA